MGKQTSSKWWNIPMLNARTHVQDSDTWGEIPLLVKIGNQAAKDIQNGSAWLDMRQAWAIWLKHNVRGASIKLNKAGKYHDNAFAT